MINQGKANLKERLTITVEIQSATIILVRHSCFKRLTFENLCVLPLYLKMLQLILRQKLRQKPE